MSSPLDTVKTFLKALNSEDFEAARTTLSDDVTFIGVMGKRDGADAYMSDMKKMQYKYDILRTFENGNDVAVFYNINMGAATIFCAGWYEVITGRIHSIKVVFDPRPLLEAQGQ